MQLRRWGTTQEKGVSVEFLIQTKNNKNLLQNWGLIFSFYKLLLNSV